MKPIISIGIIFCLVLIAGCTGSKCDPPCFAKCSGNSLLQEACVENKCTVVGTVDCGGPCKEQFMQVHGEMLKDKSGQILLGGKCASGDSYGGAGDRAGGAAGTI